MAGREVSAFMGAITADGTTAGLVTLTNTRGLYPGMVGFIRSNAIASTQVKILSVTPNKVGLQAYDSTKGPTYTNSDMSSFHVADSATLFMPQQTISITDAEITRIQQTYLDLSMSPQFLGTVTSTGTSVTNTTTAAPFTLTMGSRLLLQGDASFYVRAQTDGTGSVASTNGVLVPANTEWQVSLMDSEAALAVISVTGTANVKVWQI